MTIGFLRFNSFVMIHLNKKKYFHAVIHIENHTADPTVCWGLFWFSLFIFKIVFLFKGRKQVLVLLVNLIFFFNVAKVSVVNSEDAELWSLRKAWKKKQKCGVILPQLCSFSFQRSKIRSFQGCIQDHLALYPVVTFTSLPWVCQRLFLNLS